ncbi:MAG: InlB B-repeat-containing protein [Lachnospiraceae bacterium]|nr:InlB B-repeat-containing protein [Lachnospiraceae bacterium]
MSVFKRLLHNRTMGGLIERIGRLTAAALLIAALFVFGALSVRAEEEGTESPPEKYIITWLNDDGSVIDTTTVEAGTVPTHADPVKSATAEYSYTFTGWDTEPTAATGNATYRATFQATKNKYTIIWKNDRGGVIDTTIVEYGDVPTHDDPVRKASAEFTYTFEYWDPEPVAVTKNTAYKAVFSSTRNHYTVTWLNADDSVIDTEVLEYGVVPTHADATRENTAEFTYTFAGWNKTPKAVTRDTTYRATYTAVRNKYTIIWLNEDGSVIDTEELEYGVLPSHEDVEKEATAEYTYTFAGWDTKPVKVTENASYRATFTAKRNRYTITWRNEDGSLIDVTTVEYGTVPSHAGVEKAADAEFTYTFAGWDRRPVVVTADATYKATFKATKNQYTITWKNEDGSVIDTTSVEYGAIPTHRDMVKEADGRYTYLFVGWSPKPTAVTGDAEYTAAFMPLIIHDETEAPTEKPTTAPTVEPEPPKPVKTNYTWLWIAIGLTGAALISIAVLLIVRAVKSKKETFDE